MAGLKTRIYNGNIHRTGDIYVFTEEGANCGARERLEAFLDEHTEMSLIQLIQPDPVRQPDKLKVIVKVFDIKDIDYAGVENEVTACLNVDPGCDDITTATLYGLHAVHGGPAFPLKECPFECPRFEPKKKTSPTGRRTQPADQKLYYARVVNNDFIKFDTKLYSKQKILIVVEDLKHRFADCRVKVFEENGNPMK